MADQDADGATATVDKARFDGLMGVHQKALSYLTPEQRAELKAQKPEADTFEAQTPAPADDSQPDGQVEEPAPQWEPGTMLTVNDDGAVVEFEPPQPGRPVVSHEQAVWERSSYPVREPQEAPLAGRGFPV